MKLLANGTTGVPSTVNCRLGSQAYILQAKSANGTSIANWKSPPHGEPKMLEDLTITSWMNDSHVGAFAMRFYRTPEWNTFRKTDAKECYDVGFKSQEW
jgi:hypothetical protein